MEAFKIVMSALREVQPNSEQVKILSALSEVSTDILTAFVTIADSPRTYGASQELLDVAEAVLQKSVTGEW